MLQLNTGVLTLPTRVRCSSKTVMGKPVGKLVNVAGRQRMLSQRMAMLYLEAKLPMDTAAATAEIEKSPRGVRDQHGHAAQSASETTTRIQDELQLADSQWVFFDAALKRAGTGDVAAAKPMTDVFTASETC